ncbi:MAG: LytR C-terminal domain-containing protein [Candidatus Kapaibacteriales bacterium]
MHYKIRNIFLISISAVIILVLLIFIGSVLSLYLLNNAKESKNSLTEQISLLNLNVRILNTTKIPGLAKELKNFLKVYEIQDVTIGNDSIIIDSTILKTSRNWYSQAKTLSQIIGIDSTKIIFDQCYDTSKLKFSVLIGKDYKLLKPFRK